MLKKEFYSKLFNRNINQNELDYIAIVKAELLYRMHYITSQNINLSSHLEYTKYSNYYKKLNKDNPNYSKSSLQVKSD